MHPTRTYGYAYGSARRSLGYKRPIPKAGAGESPSLSSHLQPIRRRDLPIEGGHLIRGLQASDLEWRTWTTVKRLGWPDDKLDWQTDVLGGRLPGGRVLDIVVWTWGGPAILAVNGDYWHARGERQRQLELDTEAHIRQIFGSRTFYYPLYTADLLTDEIAERTLLLLIGRY
jgi:hypothetical protein